MKKECILSKMKQVNKKVISISDVYNEFFSGFMSEFAFFKSIERLTEAGELVKISKGMYAIPEKSKYGLIQPTTSEILSEYTGNFKGMEVGYSLYNSLNITTQVSKQVKVYSNVITGDVKKIKNIEIKKVNLDFKKEECDTIRYLEILDNYNKIEDINWRQFLVAMETFAPNYNNTVAHKVIETLNYKKRTIAFLREFLNYFRVNNDLSKYLSCYSNYQYPTMENIYEFAQRI